MKSDILSELVIQNIRSIATMYNEEGACAARKDRPFWAFVVKYEGETVYTCGGKKYVSDINNVTVLPQGCAYDWKCTKSGRFILVEFECGKTCGEILSFNVKNGSSYFDTLRKMEINRALPDPARSLEEFRDLYSILSSLVRAANKKYLPSPKERAIYPVLKYIAKNESLRISADELAAMTPYSTVWFRKVFREVTGMSPIRYIRTAKMNKAKDMLESESSAVTDIAYALGYNDVYEFSRDFKKQVGVSPSRYKNGR